METYFVTLNWNTTSWLERMIESVEATTPEPHRWIIWDNGSDQKNWKELMAFLKTPYAIGTGPAFTTFSTSLRGIDVKVVSNPENVGCIRAHNMILGMLAMTGTPHDVVLIDTDMEVREDGWLTKVREWVSDKPQIGIVGLEHAERERCAPAVFQDPSGNWYYHDRQVMDRQPAESESCGFGFALIRYPVLVEGVRFDPVYLYYYKQDADFCFEARKRGYEVWAYPVDNVHYGAASLKTNEWQVGRFSGEADVNEQMKRRNQVYFTDKWRWVLGGRRKNYRRELKWLAKAKRVMAGQYELTKEDVTREE